MISDSEHRLYCKKFRRNVSYPFEHKAPGCTGNPAAQGVKLPLLIFKMSIPTLKVLCISKVMGIGMNFSKIPHTVKTDMITRETISGRYRVMASSVNLSPPDVRISFKVWNTFKTKFTTPGVGHIALIKTSRLTAGELRLKHFSMFDFHEWFSTTANYRFHHWNYLFQDTEETYSHTFKYSDNGFHNNVFETNKQSGEQEVYNSSVVVFNQGVTLKQEVIIGTCSVRVDTVLKASPEDTDIVEDGDTEDTGDEDDDGVGWWF